MRPILLKGHERSITVVKFNFDGDLLFTASKDHIPSVWRNENGERIGTFNGHKGTIWDLDVCRFSKRVVTASADASAKLWDCETGECIKTFVHHGPVRGAAWADGSNMFATISDPFVEHNAQISVYDVPENDDPSSYSDSPRLEIDLPKTSDGNVSMLPTLFGSTSMKLSLLPLIMVQSVYMIRRQGRTDFTAKLYDVVDLKHLKTYKTDRPVNDAVISETKDHILLGGGQEAMSVTTTSGKVGKFETRFFHLVYEEEFGSVKGHFGPINALAINPNGRSYASGAEDGYIRLHYFDKSYLDMKDPVPEVLEEGEEDDDEMEEDRESDSDSD
ncbi:eukaryotic translation initiation factor 3 subunit I [Skeletonema marinoi]|uniref:Eukaryotic translation initiation factor 3 subunit I n=1 Tax=Skeletonema marinoi TaxID=267567 RepID=A0AAD9DFY8_9STRA|nr:eukaryotic translation initiation factor 3 subunit I [Skeletonema marinoi]